MDNLGDWLYIVFLVIAGVSSMFSSKKKKKRPTTVVGQPDKEIVSNEQPVPQKGFWEILQEMQKEAPKPQPKKQPKKKALKVNKPANEPFLSAESAIPNRITSSPSAKQQVHPITNEPSIMPESTFTDMAELRKAVIYAEILNRKY